MSFDPERRPRPPQGVENQLKEKQDYFDPKLVEGGFTVEEAEGLGWAVDFFHASKPFPGLGLVEVHSKDSDQGRYGVLQAVYDFELGQYRRAQGRARELYLRLVRAERQRLQAGNDLRKAIKHSREALKLSAELDGFGLRELPVEYIDELREEGSHGTSKRRRGHSAPQASA